MLGLTNFLFATISGNFTAVQLTINVLTGQGVRFTDLPARATLWNITNNATPSQAFFAGQAEVLEISSVATDQLIIVRDVEGTGAIAKIPNEEYRISVTMTEDQWNLVMRARPSNGVPGTAEGFDAVRQGTPAAITVADWLSREVYDDGVTGHGAIKSLQGGPREGNSTTLLIGDTAVPDNVVISLLKNAGVTDRLSWLLNALPFITMEGRNRMGLLTASPGQAGGLHIAQTVRADKFVGMASGGYTIDGAGAINNVNTPIIRVSAAGGPGSDDLDTINLETASIPTGGRVLLIIEPTTTAHAITIRDKFLAGGSANITLQGSAFEYLMNAQNDRMAFISDGTDNNEWVEIWRTRKEEFVHIEDRKASTTAGGTFTSGSWRRRDLNTEVADTEGLASIASSQITLAQGDYWVVASAPAYRCGAHALRLQNITDASTLLFGTNSFCNTNVDASMTHAFLHGRIVLPAAKLIELQHQCGTTRATDGFGLATGFTAQENYATIQFIRRHDD